MSLSPLKQALLLMAIMFLLMQIQLICNSETLESKFGIYEVLESPSHVFIPDITNHQKHLYPYLAAFITISCLVGVIMVIICISP